MSNANAKQALKEAAQALEKARKALADLQRMEAAMYVANLRARIELELNKVEVLN